MDFFLFLFIFGLIGAFLMALFMGANDISNAMGATLGCKALSLPKIVIVAAIFETIGAVLLGNFVGNTISSGLINLDEFVPKNATIVHSVEAAILPMHKSIWSDELLESLVGAQQNDDFAHLYMLSMGCVLFGSTLFLAIATLLSLPVSTTHAVVGSVIGNGVIIALFKDYHKVATAIKWTNLAQIVLAWGLSPFVGCISSFVSWLVLKLIVFDHKKAKEFMLGSSPFLFGLTGGILSLFVLQKGLSPMLHYINIYIPWYASFCGSILLSLVIGVTVLLIFVPLTNRSIKKEAAKFDSSEGVPVVQESEVSKMYSSMGSDDFKDIIDSDDEMTPISPSKECTREELSVIPEENTEDSFTKLKTFTEGKVFKALVIVTSCCIATAHGAGDISNASGPLAAITYMFLKRKLIDDEFSAEWWCTLVTATGLVIGLATLGYKVMRTLGEKIAKLTPARAYVAQFCTAFITLTFSVFGVPISTTHVVVGAIYGITFVDILTVKGVTFRSLNFMLIVKILSSWILTLPLAALFSGISLVFFKFCFGL